MRCVSTCSGTLVTGCTATARDFHWDYYNSFVIQPMLVDVLAAVGDTHPEWKALRVPALARVQRYAAIQERLISPEGAFPPIGRSLAYRFGALQTLAHAALLDRLPAEVAPAQVRCALTAVIRRMIDAPGTFDTAGWLRIGFAGHQPGLGRTLYLDWQPLSVRGGIAAARFAAESSLLA